MAPGHENPPVGSAYPTVFAQPERMLPDRIAPAPAAEPHLPVAPPPADLARSGRTVWPWLWFVIGITVVSVVAYFLWFIGPAGSTVGFALALAPFVLVVLALLWLDRWEPEPRGLLVFACLWGASVSIIGTLVVSFLVAVVSPALAESTVFGSVVQAPVIEELLKCAGLLVLSVMGRRAIDGPLDGVVYGALIGAGFAFVENIQYFAVALIEGGAVDLGVTFVMRGMMSPFSHIIFTGACGFLMGLAVRRGRSVFGFWAAGLVVAMALHAFWNGSTEFANFLVVYVLLQVPMFALLVVGAISLRREEMRVRRRRLEDYVSAGWFSRQEADLLSTRQGAKAGLSWARGVPGGPQLMRSFIHDGARLAGARQRVVSGRDPRASDDERVLLTRMMATRQQLLAQIVRPAH